MTYREYIPLFPSLSASMEATEICLVHKEAGADCKPHRETLARMFCRKACNQYVGPISVG